MGDRGGGTALPNSSGEGEKGIPVTKDERNIASSKAGVLSCRPWPRRTTPPRRTSLKLTKKNDEGSIMSSHQRKKRTRAISFGETKKIGALGK